MIFGVNTSPFAGRDGQFVTSRQIKDRLDRELLGNVSIRVEPTDTPEQMKVVGRGELQLSILIEMMRREGFELQVSRPEIVTKRDRRQRRRAGRGAGRSTSPRSIRAWSSPQVGSRKGAMTRMVNHGSGRVRLEFRIPARGLIGFRSQFLTETQGTGIMHHLFAGWEPWHGADSVAADRRAGRRPARRRDGLRDRQPPGARRDVHRARHRRSTKGMIVGENARPNDLDVNITREKKQTNMRASTADEAIRLIPPRRLSLEQAIEFINDDELVEVTPTSIPAAKADPAANMRPKHGHGA